jgi:hypothetical protein
MSNESTSGKDPVSIFLDKEAYLTERLKAEIQSTLGPSAVREFLDECKEANPEGLALWLQEEFMNGLAVWAIGKMGDHVAKYVDEGCENFLSLYRVALMVGYSPLKALEEAWFLFPLRRNKQQVHPARWFDAWVLYSDIRGPLEDIKNKRWRNHSSLKMALKEKLPGITTSQAEKWAPLKASDIALKYVCYKFRLPVDIEAVQKYFRHFDTLQEHTTLLSKEIRKQRAQYRS